MPNWEPDIGKSSDLYSLVENYLVKQSMIFIETLAKIKMYIHNANWVKSKIRKTQKFVVAEALESPKKEQVQNIIRQNKASKFLIKEINYETTELTKTFLWEDNLSDY